MTRRATGLIVRALRVRLLRFVVVGAASVVTNTGTLFVLHGLLGIVLPLAAALSFAVAFVVNFGLNRIWTFEADGAMLTHLWRYFALVVVNLGLNSTVVTGLTHLGSPYLISQVVTTTVLSMGNFLVSRQWIFNDTDLRIVDPPPTRAPSLLG